MKVDRVFFFTSLSLSSFSSLLCCSLWPPPLSLFVDIFAILKELTFELKKVPCVKHAIGVCSAWLSGNYCQFFRLYRTAPLMCGALINMFIERERKVALRSIIKAYVEIYSEWECRKCAAYTVFTLAFSIPFRSVPF